MRYQVIEHTADTGIEVMAASLEELFAGAAQGMSSIIFDRTRLSPSLSREIQLEAEDLGELMFKWLNELVFLVSAEGLALWAFEVHSARCNATRGQAPCCINATVRGARLEEVEGSLQLEIKAATYHELTVEKRAGEWFARVIFDV